MTRRATSGRPYVQNKGITGSDGPYNRQHRLLCQKPFMNSFSLDQFSDTVVERVQSLLVCWDTAATRQAEPRKLFSPA